MGEIIQLRPRQQGKTAELTERARSAEVDDECPYEEALVDKNNALWVAEQADRRRRTRNFRCSLFFLGLMFSLLGWWSALFAVALIMIFSKQMVE